MFADLVAHNNVVLEVSCSGQVRAGMVVVTCVLDTGFLLHRLNYREGVNYLPQFPDLVVATSLL